MANIKFDAVFQSIATVIFIACIGTVSCQNYIIANEVPENLMECYECNVWKAGYGQLCDNPRIRPNCYACVKIETIIFMGYYKNTPRYTTVISRACANSKSVPFYNECQYFTTGDGHSRRCYCNTKLCNSADKTVTKSLPILLGFIALGFGLFRFA